MLLGGALARFAKPAGVLAVLLCATAASADPGDRAVGLELAGGYPGGRVSLWAEEGLTDWVAARIEAGANIGAPVVDVADPPDVVVEGLATFACVVAFDVFAWVPEVLLGVGLAAGEPGVRARFVGRAGVRRFLSFDWSLTFGAGGEWTPLEDWAVLGSVGLWWHLGGG